MPRLFSVLAVAAAFIPAVFANETDCNVGRVTLAGADRAFIETINTEFETTRYDRQVHGLTSSAILTVTQNGAAQSGFYVSLNGNPMNSAPGNVANPSVNLSGLNTECGAENLVLVEVAQVKADNGRYDSCNFKYEIHYYSEC